MRVRKSVLTAAASSQRSLPLQTLIDRDGEEKSVLAILVEQVLLAGVDEVCVVVWPGDEARYAQALGKYAGHVEFVPQHEARGYGHAVWCARQFLKDEPFLHLVGDHLYVNAAGSAPAQRLLAMAQKEECPVSAVQPTREGLLAHFGAIGGRRIPDRPGMYRVETVIEKPTPTEAEQKLLIPGMRTGYYLCFFGIHVLTPVVMEILGKHIFSDSAGRISLSCALAELARQAEYLAMEEPHRRYDIGARYGLLKAQLALALSGPDRADVLAQLVELLATQPGAGDTGATNP
ncbi:MAG: UTP--glucose-1-phosphate uridylyltransferase [Acidobacteriia bacterium]|nr:UTP--glucose-1-phosphate uridylyltransferase [Terriglobia bacterium]